MPLSRLILLPFVLAFAATSLHAAEPIKIAVAGDPSLANLVDAVTASLSTNNDLAVLERADLDKLGAEATLQAATTTGDLSTVSIIPADGLILLRSTGTSGAGVFARLIAVQPGVVLREVALPDDPAARPKTIATEFAPYWPKLAALHHGTITALSLLGLRFEVDSPTRRPLERQFNILLASRLSAEADCVVLERWRLNDAAFEKSLQNGHVSAFWTGSSLIDGSLQERDGKIVATLRLRPPKSDGVTITDQDTPDHLSDLVDRLADKIRQRPAALKTWKPADEAARYAKLGQWCLDNQLFEEGAGALESALALGDTSRTTHMFQVKAYALEAFPDDLRVIYPSVDNFRIAKLDPATLPLRVAAACHAAELAREYLKANATFQPGPKWDPEDPVDLSVKTLNTCLRILCFAYENDFPPAHPDDFATLRHAIQPLIADLTTKLTPAPPSMQREAFLHYRAYYAGLWNDKPEDALALYRQVLKGPDSASAREQLFPPSHREPYLDVPDGVPQPAAPSWINRQSPWIAAWDGRTPSQMRDLWHTFIQQLAASPDLLDQCDAMKFEVCSDQTEAARDAVSVRFIDFVQKHPEMLSGPQREEFCEGTLALLDGLNQKTTADLRLTIVQFVTDLMHRHAVLTDGWIQAMTTYVYGPHDDENAPKILAAVNDYEDWYRKQPSPDWRMLRTLDFVRTEIYRSKPALVPNTPPPANPITITKFWRPDHPPDVRSGDSRYWVDTRTFALQGRTAWVLTFDHPGKIIGFDTSTLQTTQTVPIPPDLVPRQHTSRAHHRFLEATPDGLALGAESMALVYSRGNSQWTKLDVPPTCYKPRWTGNQLYLLYDAERGSGTTPGFASDPVAAGSGLIGVSLPGGACQDLISSRRIPPQNPLDGQPLGEPIDLWATGTKLNLSFYRQPVYSSTIGKSDWTPLPAPAPVSRGKVTSAGYLVEENLKGNHYGKLVLYDKSSGTVLLSDEGKAEWPFPANAGFDMEHAMLFSCPVLRGHDLCIFTLLQAGPSSAGQPTLIYFAEGQPNYLCIPLSFDYSEVNDPVLNKFRELATSFDSIHPTDGGVLIPEPNYRGYWLLPWADIDAWLAKATAKVTVGPIQEAK
jgi:hypothetical protein